MIEPEKLELSAEDLDDLDALYAELRGLSGITVEAVQAPNAPGEQGSALDLITVALSGGAVAKFLDIIRVMLEARGPAFKLTLRQKKTKLEITADNFEEVLPALRELMK